MSHFYHLIFPHHFFELCDPVTFSIYSLPKIFIWQLCCNLSSETRYLINQGFCRFWLKDQSDPTVYMFYQKMALSSSSESQCLTDFDQSFKLLKLRASCLARKKVADAETWTISWSSNCDDRGTCGASCHLVKCCWLVATWPAQINRQCSVKVLNIHCYSFDYTSPFFCKFKSITLTDQ